MEFTMTQLAEMVGVNRSALYYYLNSARDKHRFQGEFRQLTGNKKRTEYFDVSQAGFILDEYKAYIQSKSLEYEKRLEQLEKAYSSLLNTP